jgi:hypothetical protein
MATAVVLTVPDALIPVVVRIECATDALAVDVTCIGVIPCITVATTSTTSDEPDCIDGDLRGSSTAADPFDDEPPIDPW